MGLSRYFLHDFFAAREFNELEERRRRSDRAERQKRRADRERIHELEVELARVSMLARALSDLCLAKGVVTRDELAAALLESDLADGVQDGGLDPDVVLPGESRPADLEPLSGCP